MSRATLSGNTECSLIERAAGHVDSHAVPLGFAITIGGSILPNQQDKHSVDHPKLLSGRKAMRCTFLTAEPLNPDQSSSF